MVNDGSSNNKHNEEYDRLKGRTETVSTGTKDDNHSLTLTLIESDSDPRHQFMTSSKFVQ